MLKTKVMSEKQASPEIERQSDPLEVLYILNKNENTFPEIELQLSRGTKSNPEVSSC